MGGGGRFARPSPNEEAPRGEGEASSPIELNVTRAAQNGNPSPSGGGRAVRVYGGAGPSGKCELDMTRAPQIGDPFPSGGGRAVRIYVGTDPSKKSIRNGAT